jgi:hypothetical protein
MLEDKKTLQENDAGAAQLASTQQVLSSIDLASSSKYVALFRVLMHIKLRTLKKFEII